MNPWAISSLFSAIVMAVLGLYVHLRNPRSTLNRLFMFLCISMSYWAFAEFEMRNAETEARALFWHVADVTWPFAIALLMHFVLVFTGRTSKTSRRRRLFLLYGPALAATIGNALISDHRVIPAPWGWSPGGPAPGSLAQVHLAIVYGVSTAVTLASLFMVLSYALHASTEKNRKMAKHMGMGLAIVVTTGILTEILLPWITGQPVIELTASSCAIMAAFTTYAIVKYELFTITPTTAAESIVTTISDPLFLVDLDHKIHTTNTAACRMLGYELHELIGHPISKVFPQSTGEESNTSFIKMLETGVVHDVETSLITKEGTQIPVSLSWAMTRSKDGQTLGVTFVGRDITERLRFQESLKQARDELQERVEEQTKELTVANKMLRDEIAERMKAEEELADDKEYLSVTLASIADGVIATDRDGRIVLINRIACELTGYSRDEAASLPVEEVFRVLDESSREPLDAPLQDIVEGGEAATLREGALLLSRDGSSREVAFSGAPIRFQSGKVRGMVLVVRDISERRKLEERLFKNRKLESVSVLAAGIAHDFNNILTGIMTSLFVARTQVSSDSETYQLLSEAEQSAFRASSLTKQLLTFGKGSTPVRQRMAIRDLLAEVAGFCLSGAQVDYDLTVDDDVYEVELDRGQIDQALSSIVVNAEEAMPEGGTVRIGAANLTVRREDGLPVRPGRYVLVTIADQGPGIPEADLHRVFDPYYTTKANHNGLGLTTAHAIVSRHDGCLDVESSEGDGCTFRLYLPGVPAEKSEDFEETETYEDTVDDPVARRRVLFMDDEDYIRRTAAKLLEHLGYEAATASKGSEVVTMYREALDEARPFDAVILDLVVTGGSGARDTLAHLRELDPEVRAIVTSGYATDAILEEYEEHGFVAALTKPYTVHSMEKALKTALGE